MNSSQQSNRTEWAFLALRWLVVGTQAATIWVTWPLWQVRQSPPMLPLIDATQIDFGYLLLGSLVLVLIHEKAGVIAHSVLLLAAMLLDQMRLQPEFISQAILLWGTLPWQPARAICRAHLIALWFFSGFHKLICPYFYTGDARWLVSAFIPDSPEALSACIGATIALAEIALAICALRVNTRLIAVGLAYFLHLGIVVILAFGLHWDEAVWPWNLSLAVAGYCMIGTWRSSFVEDFHQFRLPLRAAVAAILLSPFGYEIGLVDTYLCHVLYSSHAPLAWINNADEDRRDLIDTRPQLKVPVPQIERLYRAHFAAVASPGDELEIFDPRAWSGWHGHDRQVIAFDRLAELRRR